MQRKSISCLKIGKLFATKNARSMSGTLLPSFKESPFLSSKVCTDEEGGPTLTL